MMMSHLPSSKPMGRRAHQTGNLRSFCATSLILGSMTAHKDISACDALRLEGCWRNWGLAPHEILSAKTINVRAAHGLDSVRRQGQRTTVENLQPYHIRKNQHILLIRLRVTPIVITSGDSYPIDLAHFNLLYFFFVREREMGFGNHFSGL